MFTSRVVATICLSRLIHNGVSLLFWIGLSLLATRALGEVTPTGSYSTSISIETPSFHGIAPKFALEYSSQSGNGILGVGWNLRGLSEIHQTSSTGGASEGKPTDKFWLDGIELIPCAHAPYDSNLANSPSCKCALPTPLVAFASRVETFQRIAFEPNAAGGRWFVWDKDGTKTTYIPSHSTAQWCISEVLDVHGNRVDYAYSNMSFTSSPELLNEVTYNKTHIRFYWENRSDVIGFAAKAGKLYLSHRLKSIDIQVEGRRLRAYAIKYKTSPGTKRSTLIDVAQYGTNATVDSDGKVGGPTLPATSMRYADQLAPSNWNATSSRQIVLPTLATPELPNRYQFESEVINTGVDVSFLVGDFDGDGRTDALLLSVIEDPAISNSGTVVGPQNDKIETHVRFASQSWVRGEVPFEASAHWDPVDLPRDGRISLVKAWVADVNGDGLDDLILLAWKPSPGNPGGPLQLLLNSVISNGDGTFTLGVPQFVATPWITNTPVGSSDPIPDSPVCVAGDFDGDGRADFACMFQNSAGKQYLGVAYSNSTGGFSIGTPTLFAEDSGTAVTDPQTGIVGFFPFETRRMVACDINNDGQTDLLVLDLNQDDVNACAQQHPGEDPRNYRGKCNIRFDLVAMISNGFGFEKEVHHTPWLRDDYTTAIPGSLAAADLNGDGLADAIFLTGTLNSDHFQKVKTIRTAIRKIDGSYQLAEVNLPPALANPDVHFALGDVNGDGRTDLMVAVQIGSSGGINCSSAAFNRAVLTTVTANEDGTFNFPTRWDDCSVSTEVIDQWAEWTEVPGLALLQVGDTNGDGYADYILPTVRFFGPGQARVAVYDRVAQSGNTGHRRWIGADLNGDGKTDFISIIQETNSCSAITLIAQADGTYKPTIFPIGTFENMSMRSWRIMDVNGDGKVDIVHVQSRQPHRNGACELEIQSFLSRGDGIFTREPASCAPEVKNADRTALAGIRIADVNRDGKTDLVQTLVLTDPTSNAKSVTVRTLLSNGTGWTQVPIQPINISGAPPSPAFYRLLSNLLAWHIGDFDGDGRADLLHISSNVNGARLTVASFDDTGWKGQSTVVTYPSVAGGWMNYKGLQNVIRWRVADVNGDGLSDLVRLIRTDNTTVVHSLESLGPQGWKSTVDPVLLPSGSTAEKSFGSLDWYNFDVDGDGGADFVNLAPLVDSTLFATVLYASGTGYTRVEQYTIADDNETYKAQPSQQFGDRHGTGDASLLYVERLASGVPSVRVHSMELGQVADLLIEKITGGSSTEVGYVPSGQFIDSRSMLSRAIPLGVTVRVVKWTATGDGRVHDKDTTSFTYSLPDWSSYYRTFLGWKEISGIKSKTVNRPLFTLKNTYQHSDECPTRIQSQGTVNAAGNFVGLCSIVDYVSLGISAPFKSLVRSTKRMTFGRGGSANEPAAIVTTTYQHDLYGNITEVLEDGSNGLARVIFRKFTYAKQPYIVDALAGEELHDGPDASASVLRSRIFCYDNDQTFTCSTPPTKGLLTTAIDIWEHGTRTTNYHYDAFDNLASVIDANNHGTAYFYDPVQRVFPQTFVNALGQSSMMVEWDRTLGKPTKIIGMNSDTLRLYYDEFGRVRKTVSPTGATALRNYELWGDPNQQCIVESVLDGSRDGLWTRRYLDGLGRIYRLERKSKLSSEILGQLIEYGDASDYPYRESQPIGWNRSGPFQAHSYTSYMYDEANRILRINRPDRSTVNFTVDVAPTNRLLTTVIDENGWSTQTYHDAFERLTETVSFDHAQIISTKYKYDGADQISKVVDPNGNCTLYDWDMLGRNTKIIDPDFGMLVMHYDLVGNLDSLTDARNRTITFTYDALNRLREKVYPSNQRVTWSYDELTSQNGRGRMTSFVDLTSGGGSTEPSGAISYDLGGRPSVVARCIHGIRAKFVLEYDPLGRLKRMIYPDHEVLNYEYDAAGELGRIPGVVNIRERDASGDPTRLIYGNGVSRRLTYDSDRNWLISQTDSLGNTSIFSSTYSYQPNGLVQTVKSLTNQTNLTIEYDQVRRIRGVSGSETQTWGYDLAGNIMFNSALGNYTYPGQGPTACTLPGGLRGPCKQPHAAQTAGRFSLQYDDNGLLSLMTNTTTGEMRSIDWTFDMLPAVVRDFNGTQSNFEYDPYGNRVLEVRGQDTIAYFGRLARWSSSTGFSNSYAVDDRIIATQSGGVRTWLHDDRSRSVRAFTDNSGQVNRRDDFGVFGEQRSSSGQYSNPGTFASFNVDPGTGLQYMGTRFYDPVINRFISPDAMIPDKVNTQATNRYSYNYNNPMGYTDPSGHRPNEITSSYYSMGSAEASFDFAVFGYCAMLGTMQTSLSRIASMQVPIWNSGTNAQNSRNIPIHNPDELISWFDHQHDIPFDVFVWWAEEREISHAKSGRFGLKTTLEAVGILGYNRFNGPYRAGFLATGLELEGPLKGNTAYGAFYGGLEAVEPLGEAGGARESELTQIFLLEGGVEGVLAGAYETSGKNGLGDPGSYFGIRVGGLGSLGIGFNSVETLRSILVPYFKVLLFGSVDPFAEYQLQIRAP